MRRLTNRKSNSGFQFADTIKKATVATIRPIAFVTSAITELTLDPVAGDTIETRESTRVTTTTRAAPSRRSNHDRTAANTRPPTILNADVLSATERSDGSARVSGVAPAPSQEASRETDHDRCRHEGPPEGERVACCNPAGPARGPGPTLGLGTSQPPEPPSQPAPDLHRGRDLALPCSSLGFRLGLRLRLPPALAGPTPQMGS